MKIDGLIFSPEMKHMYDAILSKSQGLKRAKEFIDKRLKKQKTYIVFVGKRGSKYISDDLSIKTINLKDAREKALNMIGYDLTIKKIKIKRSG